MPEAVVVAAARSPIGRAVKDSLNDMRPDDLASPPGSPGRRSPSTAVPRWRAVSNDRDRPRSRRVGVIMSFNLATMQRESARSRGRQPVLYAGEQAPA